MAKEAALVAQRCIEAQETGVVDLFKCSLLEIPIALYLFLKNTNVTKLNLSSNFLKLLPRKVAKEFPNLEEIDLSGNKGLNKLPDELAALEKLISLNLSGNQFVNIPCLPSSLKTLNLSNNLIESISDHDVETLTKLDDIDLTGNTLNDDSKKLLKEYPKIKI